MGMSFEKETSEKQEPSVNENSQEQLYSKEFEKIITDFTNDIKISFSEYEDIINSYYTYEEIEPKLNVDMLFNHVMNEFPEKFFDILYQNEELFEKSENNKKELLPNIDFVELWNLDGITDSIKEKIWKYLQLVLFSVVSHVKSNESFGDMSKLFEQMGLDTENDETEETDENKEKDGNEESE